MFVRFAHVQTVGLMLAMTVLLAVPGCGGKKAAGPTRRPKDEVAKGPAKKAEPKKAEPKKSEPKKAEPKKAEPKKSEPKKTEPKKPEPKKTEPKKTEPKKAEPKKAEPKKPEPKKTEPKKAEPKKAELKKAAPVGPPAPGYGHLRGRFVLKGTPPKFPAPTISKDVSFCGKFQIPDENVVVGKDGALANVAVFLYVRRGKKAPQPHASYAASAKANVPMDNAGCRFVPHIVFCRVGQTLLIRNPDTVVHNSKGATFNPTIPPGLFHAEPINRVPSLSPMMPIGCSIHPWMSGYVIIQDHPYGTVTDAKGRFVLQNLPPGTHTFQFWQEAAGYVSDVTVDGKKTTWSKGRVKLKIEPGKVLDLGTITVTPELFE